MPARPRYTCGFPCTPFSVKGRRLQWNDDSALPLKACVKTIAALKPYIYIIENVPALIYKGGQKKMQELLGLVDGYETVFLKDVTPTDAGVPQYRPRLYIVGFRKDRLRIPCDGVAAKLKEIIASVRIEPEEYHVYLEKAGFPIQRSHVPASSQARAPASRACACSCTGACPLHVCTCNQCKKHGPAKLKCLWRRRHAKWAKAAPQRIKAKAFAKKWTNVLKNPVKKPPGYFALADNTRLDTSVVGCPRQRDVLEQLSMTTNLLRKTAVLDLNSSIDRVQLREDGVVGALGCSCANIFAPAFGTKLTAEQCFALQGLDAHELDLASIPATSLYRLAGNAMAVPSIGLVMGASLSLLKPARSRALDDLDGHDTASQERVQD